MPRAIAHLAVSALCLLGAAGCAFRPAPPPVWDARQWSSGLPLPITETDFPGLDPFDVDAIERTQPTSIGATLLKAMAGSNPPVRDHLREHGLPDGALVTHGPRLNLFYLAEDRVHFFDLDGTQLRPGGSEPITGADRAALNREVYLGRAARQIRENLAKLARLGATFRRVRMAVGSSDTSGRSFGVLFLDADPPARHLFGLGDATAGIVVGLVDPDGPASALLKAGDVVTHVGSTPVLHTGEVRVPDHGPLELVLAGSAPRRVVIEAEPVPVRSSLFLAEAAVPTAITTGDRIVVTTGLLNLVENDDQLAFAIGHELAHVVEGHAKLTAGRILREGVKAGVLLPLSAVPIAGVLLAKTLEHAASAFDREQERTADRLGISYAARAGYDPHKAVRLLERLGEHFRQYPLTRESSPQPDSHPSVPERIANVRQVIATLPPPAAD